MLGGKPPSIRSLRLQISLCSKYELRVFSLKDVDYMAFDYLLSTSKQKLGMLAIAPRCDNPFMEGGFGSAQLKKLLTPTAAKSINVLELGCQKLRLDPKAVIDLLPDLEKLLIVMDQKSSGIGRHSIDYERLRMPG